MMRHSLRAAKQAWRHCRCSSEDTEETVRHGDAAITSAGMSLAATSTSSCTLAVFALVQFCDHLDLDTTPQRQLGNAKCRARVLADIAKNVADQLGAAVSNEMVLGEVR